MNCPHCNLPLKIDFSSITSWTWYVVGFDILGVVIYDGTRKEEYSSGFRCRACGAEFSREQAMKLMEGDNESI